MSVILSAGALYAILLLRWRLAKRKTFRLPEVVGGGHATFDTLDWLDVVIALQVTVILAAIAYIVLERGF